MNGDRPNPAASGQQSPWRRFSLWLSPSLKEWLTILGFGGFALLFAQLLFLRTGHASRHSSRPEAAQQRPQAKPHSAGPHQRAGAEAAGRE